MFTVCHQTCIWSPSSSVSWTPPSPPDTALCSSRNVVPSSSVPSYSPSSPVLASSRRSASWYSVLVGSCRARCRIRLPRCANCLWQCVHRWLCVHMHTSSLYPCCCTHVCNTCTQLSIHKGVHGTKIQKEVKFGKKSVYRLQKKQRKISEMLITKSDTRHSLNCDLRCNKDEIPIPGAHDQWHIARTRWPTQSIFHTSVKDANWSTSVMYHSTPLFKG